MNNVMVAYNIVYVVITAIGVSLFGLIFLSTRRKAREKPMNVSSWKKRENVWFIVVVLALATGTGSIILDSFASGWTQALWFAAVPAGAALIAMATARVTVSRFLARAA